MRDPFRRIAVIVLVIAALVVGGVVVLHYLHLSSQRSDLDTAAAQGPVVQTAVAGQSASRQTVTVLASVRPFLEATLYAKVSGYLGEVLVDKGYMVKKDQLLATIQSQETDAQYESARADYLNKQQIAKRYDQLLRQSAIAPQQADQADADARVAAAALDQDRTLKSYERIIAPFDGRVTARFADPGALVQNATTSQTSAQPVVTVSDDRSLRVQAYVQQSVAPFVHQGDSADIVDAANPAHIIHATITNVAGQLDATTRTMLVEVILDNRGQQLLGGSFAYMTLHVPVPLQTQVPVSGLIGQGDKQSVAVVGNDSRLHFTPVTVASTDGETVNLASGVQPGTRIALNLPPEAVDGSLVRTGQTP
jgi:RND family efflux transporter MFP subunit